MTTKVESPRKPFMVYLRDDEKQKLQSEARELGISTSGLIVLRALGRNVAAKPEIISNETPGASKTLANSEYGKEAQA